MCRVGVADAATTDSLTVAVRLGSMRCRAATVGSGFYKHFATLEKSQLFHGKIQARRRQKSTGEIRAKRHPLPGPHHPWDRRHVPAILFRAAVGNFMRPSCG